MLFVAGMILTVSAIAQPAATSTPVQTVMQPTAPPAQTPQTPVTEQKFRVGPVVKFRPVNDVVDKSQDGIVELFMSNPSLNDVNLHVDAYVDVPSGMHVYGEGFAQASAAGTTYGTFEVPPGTARTIHVNIKSEKVGKFTLHFSGMYYPGTNKDLFQPLSLTYPITVNEPSPNPDDSSPTNPEQIKSDVTGTPTQKQTKEAGAKVWIPGFTSIFALCAIIFAGLLALYRRNR